MKYSIAFALIVCFAASSAFAAKKKARDVYPATEDTPSEEVIQSAPGYSAAAAHQAPAPITVSAVAAPQAAAAPQALAGSSSKYDSVPGAQAEPLLRRLRLVEELIAKYGRAYDYRTLTVTQLQAILGELDAQASQSSELKRRMSARTELKKTVQASTAEEIPAPAPESTNSIGSEAPESAAPFQGGGIGADSLAPPTN